MTTVTESYKDRNHKEETMAATKDQERKALEKIKKIIEELGGADSYIGTALEGCLEIAQDNIENDFACSMKQRAEDAQTKVDTLRRSQEETARSLRDAEEKIAQLQQQLEKELEWEPYEPKENVTQADYKKISECSWVNFISEEKAEDLICDWFGFQRGKVSIRRCVPKYEINRHGQLRGKGGWYRPPVYGATDFNYIRFDCECMSYEVYNGDLRFFDR